MFARAEVVPLVALCIDFEGWGAFIAQRRVVPIVNALYSCWRIALLLQIICNWDLLDVLYIHCDFVLMFEMNDSQPFFWRLVDFCLVGRSYTIGTPLHPTKFVSLWSDWFRYI